MTDRVEPHEHDAEVAVLGSMLLDPEAADLAVRELTPHDFSETNGRVFGSMAELLLEAGALDIVLVTRRIEKRGDLERVGGAAFLSQILASVPTAANAKHYIDTVKGAAKRRAMIARLEIQLVRLYHGEDTADVAERLVEASESGSSGAGEPRGMTLAELRAGDFPEPEWFVEPLLGRERVTLVVASPKCGKSLTTQAILTQLVSEDGGEWLGCPFRPHRGLRAVYFAGEGGPSLLKKRDEVLGAHLAEGLDARIKLFAERPFPRIDTARGVRTIRRAVRDFGADVLAIDPLALFRDIENESSNASALQVADALRAIAEDMKVAVLICHHPSRSAIAEGTSGSLGGGRGGSALLGAVDAAVSLRKHEKTGEIHATFEVRAGRGIEPGRRLKINPETLLLDYVGDLGAHGRTTPEVQAEKAEARARDARAAFEPRGEWVTRQGIEARVACGRTAAVALIAAARQAFPEEFEERTVPGSRGLKEFRLRPVAEVSHKGGDA